mmetsp:Transcript_39504/g.97807  ORF Transcript_39504/g.97807 Transcript_39504/m.97807 type:complete len:342 (-) Transcript_39504:47-1072(-)
MASARDRRQQTLSLVHTRHPHWPSLSLLKAAEVDEQGDVRPHPQQHLHEHQRGEALPHGEVIHLQRPDDVLPEQRAVLPVPHVAAGHARKLPAFELVDDHQVEPVAGLRPPRQPPDERRHGREADVKPTEDHEHEDDHGRHDERHLHVRDGARQRQAQALCHQDAQREGGNVHDVRLGGGAQAHGEVRHRGVEARQHQRVDGVAGGLGDEERQRVVHAFGVLPQHQLALLGKRVDAGEHHGVGLRDDDEEQDGEALHHVLVRVARQLPPEQPREYAHYAHLNGVDEGEVGAAPGLVLAHGQHVQLAGHRGALLRLLVHRPPPRPDDRARVIRPTGPHCHTQ